MFKYIPINYAILFHFWVKVYILSLKKWRIHSVEPGRTLSLERSSMSVRFCPSGVTGPGGPLGRGQAPSRGVYPLTACKASFAFARIPCSSLELV